MKKMIQWVIILGVFLLQVQTVCAADQVWADEEYDLSSVRRMYFSSDLNYSQIKKSPTCEELLDVFYKQGIKANAMVLQQADLERFLLSEFSVDLKTVEKKEIEATVAKYLANYVDAYIETTIVHNSRIVVFYDVYEAKNGKKIFSYQKFAGSSDEDNIETYEGLVKDFYRTLKKETEKQLKKAKKK